MEDFISRFRQALDACSGVGLPLHPVMASCLLMMTSGLSAMVLDTTNRSLDYKTIINTMRQLFARPSCDPTPVNPAEALSVSVYTNRNGKGQGRGKGKNGGDTCHACGQAGHWARDCPVNPPRKTDSKTEPKPVTC